MRHAAGLAALLFLSGPLVAADNSIVAEGAKLEKLWGEGEFTEGPAYGPDACIYFSDIGNRIMKFDPATGKTAVYREPSGRANGLDFDPQGRLVAAEGADTGGNRRVTVTDKDGKVRVLADRWQGKRFNSPNDLTIDTKGRVYFTDPRYVGSLDEPREIATESVYRIDPDGTVTQIITDVQKPNGIVLSPDMKTLYVADSNPKGNQQLLAFPLQPDGSVGPKRLLHDFGKQRGIDGMCVDVEGNIYGAAGTGATGGVYVFDPQGKQRAFIPTPEVPTNCVFGGKDRKTLYVTAGKSLYRIRLKVAGFAVFWPKMARAEAVPDSLKAAVERSLPRIEQGASNYIKNRQCFSCHHQAMSILSLTSARKRGFPIEPATIGQQIDFTLDTFRPKHDQIVEGNGIPGASTMAVYALIALEAGGHVADETSAALVDYLLVRQRPDGSWPALTNRPPTEGSAFTNTALALRGLRAYGPGQDAKDRDERCKRVEAAFAKGRDWLLKNKPVTTEDKVFHLRGLVNAQAHKERTAAARDLLLKEQREDGSWAQLPELTGDAYATGSALMALRTAGVAVTDAAYQKGVNYLLATQKEDGSWIVQTRSRPVQVFFDNGDPGGKSQFISFVATNWAVLALLETLPAR